MINAYYTLYRRGKGITSIKVSYNSMGIALCFRFKHPRNYWKTLKPETQEELKWLLYSANLESVKLSTDPESSYWDPWDSDKNHEDSNSSTWWSWSTWGADGCYCREKVFEIELDREFLEYIRDDQEDEKFKYRLDQSIQRYKNYILGRAGKGPKYRNNEKREDPFKYQKYRYVKK